MQLFTRLSGYPRTRKCDLKLLMLSSNKYFEDFSQKCKCFAFNKSFFHARRVTGSGMRVLLVFT